MVGAQTQRILKRILIAIPEAHRYEYGECNDEAPRPPQENRREAVRETWWRDIPADVTGKFFYGRGGKRQPLGDEVFLDCADDYPALNFKMQTIYRWALDRDFEYVFRCDNDTFVYVNRLLNSNFQSASYTGYCVDYPKHHEMHRYATAGPGYWLDRKGMEIIVRNNLPFPDDLNIGRVLYQNGIKCKRDTRYVPGFDAHYVDLSKIPADHPYITFHSCTPGMMRELYSRKVTGTPEAPERTLLEPDYDFGYGRKDADCPCRFCQRG